ncbi:hypothetical protein OA238_c20990 [Octadecabacter arcticus 238]|uniref:Uncharacterized protein n=1 Tax=Octadecabacter arcticus 238 TaxID=391616 RepID=M9RJ20_9RHOB|nr:hypothetical protein [Octadecabacter arcticus]AGI72192.1 hypothetical protein OA238_c20990 [Octadecabacter arcticus 238]
MRPIAPKIGFDRFIRLEWATKALEVRAGLAEIDELEAILDEAHSGPAARKKTRTVLNRLWLEPRKNLEPFALRAVELFQAAPNTPPAILTWGMAIVTYPFFAKVAEIIGRLTSLQGDCTTAEVHRRMAEIYGEREGTRRMTNMVIQSLDNWVLIERQNKGKLVLRKQPINIEQSSFVNWLVEACLLSSDRPIAIASLEASPLNFPFYLGSSIPYILSESKTLEVRADGAGTQVVAIIS